MPNHSDGNQVDQPFEAPLPPDACDTYTLAQLEAIVDARSTEAVAEELSVHLAECADCRARIHVLLERLDTMLPNPVVPHKAAEKAGARKAFASLPQTVYPGFRVLGPGDFIGRFEIGKVLGKGGTSIVYECMDHRMGRRVAIKVLNRNAFDVTNLARLKREAQLLGRLDHPSIVRAFEIQPLHNPPYVVLELVSGGTARDLLADGPLPHREAARLIAEVAEAVHQAHEHGILHRDIKPSNLLIEDSFETNPRRDCIGVRLKVSDFGLARPLKETSELTSTNAIVGTPAYMSPEQTLGGEVEIGPASDIYALGDILFEFLAGRPPLVADNALRTMQRIQEEEPLPPRSILSSIPADLETICMKCLRKKPEDRYATALDLARDLKRFLEGEPIVARPVGNIEKVRKWVGRNIPLSVALASSAFLAIFLMAMTIRFAIVQNRLRLESDSNAAKAESNATTARLNADRYEKAAKDYLIESDLTRNYMFLGIRNLDQIAKELADVQNHDDAVRLSEKAKKLNSAGIRRYLSRESIDAQNLKGEKIDMLFRDGRNLMLLGRQEDGVGLLKRIMSMAVASRPDNPDYDRLQNYGMLVAMIMATEIAPPDKPTEATRYLLEAWRKLGSPINSKGTDREFLYVRKMVLDRLLESAKFDYASPEQLSADERSRIEAESRQIDQLLQ